ncbi:MAG: eight-cysteine-cluster domain-containing protein [Archaeoglobaceae archaeon]
MKKIALALILAIPLLVVNAWMWKNGSEKISYEVLNCTKMDYRQYYQYDAANKTITAVVTVNCASDEIIVVKGERIKIIERDYDGILAKCVCQKVVKVYGVNDVGVDFIDLFGVTQKLEKSEFCGVSTFTECRTDEDCRIGGCSGQVCMGVGDEIITSCEYRECYDHRKYGIICKCVNNMCQWV